MQDCFCGFQRNDEGYRTVNAGGQEFSEIIPNMDIFMTIIATKASNSMKLGHHWNWPGSLHDEAWISAENRQKHTQAASVGALEEAHA
jgi:hypothetical protein